MAAILSAPPLLTYDDYMTEGHVEGRYSIVNGVRIFMSGATWNHQRIVLRISRRFGDFEQESGLGLTVVAPFDVLIRRLPRLQTRQPDVLFISHARLASGGGIPQRGPLAVGPELVVEIISDTETQRILADKIADYCAVGVAECWVVRPDTRTVEILALSSAGAASVAVYDASQSAASLAFPALQIPVADCFSA